MHELKRYRFKIIGQADGRWLGFGETSTDEGYSTWFISEECIHRHGVAFIVRKKVINSVISCTSVYSRLISIRISARPHNINVIQVYEPTSDYIVKVPKKYTLIF